MAPSSTANARRASSGELLSYTLLVVVAIFFAVPIVWLVFEAAGGNIGLWMWNSLLYSGAGAVIAVAVGVPAGYGIATHDFPGRRPLLIITIVVMLIPNSALVLPLFLEAHSTGLLKSPLALILPYGLFPFGVYLSYLFFNTERFHLLAQAARVDGCNEWTVFRRVAVPLAGPVTALTVFLNFVSSWTNFFLPWVMYWSLDTTDRYPLALGIALQLFNGQTYGNSTSLLQLHTTSPPSQIAFLLLVSAAPVVLVFVIAQRWIASGQLREAFR